MTEVNKFPFNRGDIVMMRHSSTDKWLIGLYVKELIGSMKVNNESYTYVAEYPANADRLNTSLRCAKQWAVQLGTPVLLEYKEEEDVYGREEDSTGQSDI